MCLLPAGLVFAASADRAPRLLYVRVADGNDVIAAGPADDARSNVSHLVPPAGLRIPEWKTASIARGGVLADEIFQRLHDSLIAFDILVIPFRPASGDYTMAILGGTPDLFGLPAGVDGISEVDCGDQNADNVIFIFENRSMTPEIAAQALAHEAGHSFGLDHSSLSDDIMFPVVDGRDATFVNMQAPTIAPVCAFDEENTFELLTTNVGSWPAGSEKPLFLGDGTVVSAPQGCQIAGRRGRAGEGLPAGGAGVTALALSIARRRRTRGTA